MNSIVKEPVWIPVGPVSEFSEEGGVCAQVDGTQVAVFRFSSRNEWFACENRCPHTGDMVLSRGMIGDSKGEPKVACPMHKKSFSLRTGECISGDEYSIKTYPIHIEDGMVYIGIEKP
ncbi:nitrite reductase small subunit NirD [Leptospira langatensis]|uniref:Nitrite reductase small subunit NirD n=1 Tax=Leptospira langatensis TaxID=2484983 RepID=A0A5F1ZUV3_9LEPT|nr:nitrite reductase small subunit NirD [Leptospira langatensis]TGK01504.1 nitrite reductase small subunit NirD [Leptospira langatensis]TGL42046.1 nitrite reductase small subunit NirD [Leptospira langatensis]